MVGIVGHIEAQAVRDMHLAACRADQVEAPDDLGHALERIVRHHRKLVGGQVVGSPDDEIAGALRQYFANFTLNPVLEYDGVVVDPQSNSTRSLPTWETITTGARVDARGGQVLAAASAPIGLAAVDELVHEFAVIRSA
jgi:hypothetical protein